MSKRSLIVLGAASIASGCGEDSAGVGGQLCGPGGASGVGGAGGIGGAGFVARCSWF